MPDIEIWWQFMGLNQRQQLLELGKGGDGWANGDLVDSEVDLQRQFTCSFANLLKRLTLSSVAA